MKNYMPLNGLRWSRDSGSANCDMLQSDVLGRPGGGNSENTELTQTRNVLTEGRLSLFVGAMMAALFVSVCVGCYDSFPSGSTPKTPENAAESTSSSSDSTKNEGEDTIFVDMDQVNK